MDHRPFFSVAIVLLLGALNSANAQKSDKPGPRFLEDIELGFGQQSGSDASKSKYEEIKPVFSEKKLAIYTDNEIEKATAIQLKYALLLDTEVEAVSNISLFAAIDEWYGTRYRYGGTSKSGIDCSALVQALFTDEYNITLPRTAKEQHAAAQLISRTEIKQGDLVFFNTRGGISHVGIYLQNNKFVHAASSGGVMISDLYDQYWVKRIIGVGRIEGVQSSALFLQP